MSTPQELILPTMFRGVMWDEHWEFDAPCVLYAPYKRYCDGGNTGAIDRLIEDVCEDICCGRVPQVNFYDDDLHEFEWRKWSADRFHLRKNATHVQVRVAWKVKFDGGCRNQCDRPELFWDFADRIEQRGPFVTT